MPTEVLNIIDRFSGAVRFAAEITCSPDALPSLKLGLAVNVAVKARADLSGAYLRGADLRGADLRGAYLSGADLREADLRGAYLRGADLRGADLREADLRGADLRGADLRGADLRGADLSGADLRGADLRGADLRGAYLSGEKITRLLARVTRLIESYEFFAFELEAGGYKIAAGCRWYTDAEFRAHVAEDYPGTEKAAETLAILDFIKARAKALKVTKAGAKTLETVA